jgi:tetraacyldisaccharide 4'-kinase
MGTSETPPFWWHEPDWRAFALAPAALAYAGIARRHLARDARETVDVPILRIGDFAVGVPGKTQTAMAFARAAKKMGHRPGIFCLAPSGFRSASHLIDAAHDSVRHVGEAAIEMASAAPVAVCKDGAPAARMLAAEGCDFLIFSDGNLAQSLRTHFTLVVVDARRGLGNGHVMPAGPLRCSLTDQVRNADALLRIGDSAGGNMAVRAAARAARPVYEAHSVPAGSASLAGRRLLAFTAVKDPDGFFGAVENAGGILAARRVFSEGHHLAAEELRELLAEAQANDAGLVTTRRDAIGLDGGEALPDGFRERLEIAEMAVEFELDTTAPAIIEQAIDKWRKMRAA